MFWLFCVMLLFDGAFFLIWGKTSFFPKIWPLGQAAKTSPSHGEIGSSILPGVTIFVFRAASPAAVLHF